MLLEIALDENRSLAEYALKEIQELYRIEHMADKEELSYQERADLRQRVAAEDGIKQSSSSKC